MTSLEPSPAGLMVASLALWVAWNPCAVAAESASPELLTLPCNKNEECKTIRNAVCNISLNKCVCEQDLSPMSSNICGKKLGDTCNGTCYAQYSICKKIDDISVCTCEDGLKGSRDGTFCYGTPILYGAVCDNNDDCSFIGSHVECKRHSCKCIENYVRSGGACMEKIDQLGAKCDADKQVCHGDTEDADEPMRECWNGICKCRSKFVPHSGTCKEKINLLGAPCNDSRHVCYLEGDKDQKLICRSGVCQCKDSFVLDGGKCMKKVEILGAKCVPETEICFVQSEGFHPRRHCNKGVCQCRNSFKNDNGVCKQKISLLGAPCNTMTDVCYRDEDGDIQKLACIKGVCQCMQPYALKDAKCKMEEKCRGETSHIGPSVFIIILALALSILQKRLHIDHILFSHRTYITHRTYLSKAH